MSNSDAKVYWDDVALVPFVVNAIKNKDPKKNDVREDIWISYEDARSARKKAEYVRQMSLGGCIFEEASQPGKRRKEKK